MQAQRHIARDISYAHSASTRAGRAVIRLMENSTGGGFEPDPPRCRL